MEGKDSSLGHVPASTSDAESSTDDEEGRLRACTEDMMSERRRSCGPKQQTQTMCAMYVSINI